MTPQRFRLHNVGSMLGTFGVANLQADPNCVLAQLPDYGVWGLQDFPPGTYTETQRYQWAAQKQVPWLRRNRFINTATLSTQTVLSVTAVPITVSFKGTGTITFSTAYSGSLVGTGVNDRVTATFTPSAGNLVCTVSGTVTEAQCENASAATEYQPIGASWDATYAALAAAAGFNTGIWQDAGTNPVNTSGNATGMIVDASKGGLNALGPELVTNGTFTTDTTGWTNESATSIASEGGELKIVAPAPGTGATQQITGMVLGSTYAISAKIRTVSGVAASFRILDAAKGNYRYTGSDITSASLTTISFLYTQAYSESPYIYIRAGAAGTIYADDVTIKKIPGYTAIQATAANRPLWTLDANAKAHLLGDNVNDAMPVTFPASFSSNASVYVTTDAGTTVTDGVTLNGSYAPLVATKQYARVVFANGRPAYHEKLIRWLNAKAGL